MHNYLSMTDLNSQNMSLQVHPPHGAPTRTLNFSSFAYDKKAFLQSELQTGHALWPCFRLLVDKIGELDMTGASVLELGCGLGLCGSVASVLAGNRGRVVFTDGDRVVVDKAQEFSLENLIPSTDSQTEFRVLRWGDDLFDSEIELKKHGLWHEFDFVLGSDLLYGKPTKEQVVGGRDLRVRDLLKCAKGLFKPDGPGAIYLAMERRNMSFDGIMDTARDLELDCQCILFEDLFANRTDIMTDFWQFCLFEMTVKK